jgi:ABC-type transport system substrate-binding protein
MGLEEQELREWVQRVADGRASRRDFIRTMLGLGLAGPLITEMLATHMSARAQGTADAPQTFTPTQRGGGGKLRLLYWSAPMILNAHLGFSMPDAAAARVVSEPLISIDPEGDFIPILAQEIPSVENGGRAPDGTWTIWRLKQGVVWHDGTPFTADDVLFTWEFATDPGNPDTNAHFYADMQDMQMISYESGIDPQVWMRRFVSWDIAQKANNWAGQNRVRWANAECNRLWQQAKTELDPVKRAALFIRMNDLVIEDVVVIPVVWRKQVHAVSHSLRGLEVGPWDYTLWNLAYWYREA